MRVTHRQNAVSFLKTAGLRIWDYVAVLHTPWGVESHSKTPQNEMKQFIAVIEKCPDTDLYVGHVPGFPGANSQGSTLEELNANMQEVLSMLLEDDIQPESEFIGTQLISAH